jgi:cytochrome c-type biogenesis protein
LPFLIVGIFTDQAMAFIGKSGKILRYFNIVVGILLLVLGILVFTNNLTSIASFIVPQGFIN